MDTCEIIGVRSFVSSNNGKTYTQYFYLTDFQPYEMNSASFIRGSSCGQEMISGSPLCNVGDVVRFVYAKRFDGKAITTDIDVLEKKS